MFSFAHPSSDDFSIFLRLISSSVLQVCLALRPRKRILIDGFVDGRGCPEQLSKRIDIGMPIPPTTVEGVGTMGGFIFLLFWLRIQRQRIARFI
jgi:hypothetical protein